MKYELEDSLASILRPPKDQLVLSPEDPKLKIPVGSAQAVSDVDKRKDKDKRGNTELTYENQEEGKACPEHQCCIF